GPEAPAPLARPPKVCYYVNMQPLDAPPGAAEPEDAGPATRGAAAPVRREADPRSASRAAWWLATRRRRPEWQSLVGAGRATFTGRPRANFESAQTGDPVLLYVARPDRAIRAVGVITHVGGSPRRPAPASADGAEAEAPGP